MELHSQRDWKPGRLGQNRRSESWKYAWKIHTDLKQIYVLPHRWELKPCIGDVTYFRHYNRVQGKGQVHSFCFSLSHTHYVLVYGEWFWVPSIIPAWSSPWVFSIRLLRERREGRAKQLLFLNHIWRPRRPCHKWNPVDGASAFKLRVPSLLSCTLVRTC